MKYVLMVFILCMSALAGAQNAQSPEQIRQQMAKIRQTTNWDDPAAAKKANEEIQKLAKQLGGGKAPFSFSNPQQQAESNKPASIEVKSTAVSKEKIVAIADRFFQRSYKSLDAISKQQFDLDLKAAKDAGYDLEAVRTLTGNGGVKLTFGNDHHIACVYLATAVKLYPTDTLSVNNFGAYLRMIDSTALSIPVLLYANELFSQSPIILTQLGNSYFELNDLVKAESFYKKALKINPDFGQAHTSLCDLYIKQNRLQDAILELFAGVKGMGCSYRQASNNFSYLKSQAENSPDGASEKEKFWDETRNQMNPPDPLASLVPEVDRMKIPAFGNCFKVSDWIEGGGFASAAQAYNRFNNMLIDFASEFQQVQKEVPDLPPNAVLLDYPNERFALDCILEYFFKKSKDEYDNFSGAVDDIMVEVKNEADVYFQNAERIVNDFTRCTDGCGTDQYCVQECHRVYCTSECPSANMFNSKLQGHWEDYLAAFQETKDNQKKILDDLYEFTGQWFSKIYSPYWSKIYAYEIQRVALSIIGNAYVAYQMPFPGPVHNTCGTDCSAYANPYPIPPEEVKKEKPKANQCPEITKIKISAGPCDLGLDCESIEFGCTEGVSASIKRNFVKKTTTGFIGAGFKGSAGFISAGVKAGMEITVTDNNEITAAGFKAEASASAGSGVTKVGASTSGSFSIMTGFGSKVGTSVGGKAW